MEGLLYLDSKGAKTALDLFGILQMGGGRWLAGNSVRLIEYRKHLPIARETEMRGFLFNFFSPTPNQHCIVLRSHYSVNYKLLFALPMTFKLNCDLQYRYIVSTRVST